VGRESWEQPLDVPLSTSLVLREGSNDCESAPDHSQHSSLFGPSSKLNLLVGRNCEMIKWYFKDEDDGSV